MARRRAQPERMRLLVGLHGACDRALFAVVSTRCGTPVAYVEARPGFDGRGYGVDGMVRAPGAPAGAMELALNSLLEHRREAGDTWFSLGAVPLQGMDRSRPLLALIRRGLRDGARQPTLPLLRPAAVQSEVCAPMASGSDRRLPPRRHPLAV